MVFELVQAHLFDNMLKPELSMIAQNLCDRFPLGMPHRLKVMPAQLFGHAPGEPERIGKKLRVSVNLPYVLFGWRLHCGAPFIM